MQRRKALITAASISLALFSAATAMAVNTGLLLSTPAKGVGELTAVSAEAVGPAPADTVPAQPPQTIIVRVPRSAIDGATAGAPAPTAPPSTVTSGERPRTTSTTTTVQPPRTSTTVHHEDDDHRPSGGEDDD